jgi:hypothetical protein
MTCAHKPRIHRASGHLPLLFENKVSVRIADICIAEPADLISHCWGWQDIPCNGLLYRYRQFGLKAGYHPEISKVYLDLNSAVYFCQPSP